MSDCCPGCPDPDSVRDVGCGLRMPPGVKCRQGLQDPWAAPGTSRARTQRECSGRSLREISQGKNSRTNENEKSGRGERIRTSGLYVPNVALYQAKLHPDDPAAAASTMPQAPSTPWRDGTTHVVMSPLVFLQRLAALVPRPRLHLIRFHGVAAPNARLRAQAVPKGPAGEEPVEEEPVVEDAPTGGAAAAGATSRWLSRMVGVGGRPPAPATAGLRRPAMAFEIPICRSCCSAFAPCPKASARSVGGEGPEFPDQSIRLPATAPAAVRTPPAPRRRPCHRDGRGPDPGRAGGRRRPTTGRLPHCPAP